MCELLVGLGPDVEIRGVLGQPNGPVLIFVQTRLDGPVGCPSCGSVAVVKDRPVVELVDLCSFGRPARLMWRKRRWECPDPDCEKRSFTEQNPAIAPARGAMTVRAGRWCCEQVGRQGRTVAEVARGLGCDWHTVNDAVIGWGAALLAADAARIGPVAALGLDETLFCRTGPWRTQSWCTSIVDVGTGQLLDVAEGRNAAVASAWIDNRPTAWRAGIDYGVLDMSGPYRKTFDDSLPDATQVIDPFHVAKHANSMLDECRRRVQNETLGHRGHKHDPLYRSRRLLTKGHERLDEHGHAKLMGLLEAGDPHGEVRMAWHAKETVRSLYQIADPDDAATFLDELVDDMSEPTMPVEVQDLAGTLTRWRDQILAWHTARVSNGPTEAVNNLIKRIKRIGFGFKKFANYRIRVLLYAGRPNWDLLDSLNPAQIR
jgi:transposase